MNRRRRGATRPRAGVSVAVEAPPGRAADAGSRRQTAHGVPETDENDMGTEHQHGWNDPTSGRELGAIGDRTSRIDAVVAVTGPDRGRERRHEP